jgi:UDP-N-acetylmuramate dehydrogenase
MEEFSARGRSASGGKNYQKLFLGRGSNVLFTKDFDGIVIINRLKGIKIIKEDENNVWIRSMGGEWWHDLVLFAVNKGYWGIENLALIPGTVGATPVQNIGAYGVELKDVLENVEAFNILNGEKKIFSHAECCFGYRDSVFKQALKGKYFISAITVKLNKLPKENTSYKALEEYLKQNPEGKSTSYGAGNLEKRSPRDISDAISAIRQSKLPDPKILGNAGSFFKNVYVNQEKFETLKKEFPEMPFFEEEKRTSPLAPLLIKERESPTNVGQGEVNIIIKIPAGWLIEQCEWKGKRIGKVGVHDKQALVLVNYGGATGQEILDLANKIIDSVFQKFGVKLAPEVNILM